MEDRYCGFSNDAYSGYPVSRLSRELARLMAKGVEEHEVKGGWTGEGNCSNGAHFVGDFVGTFNGLATGRSLSHFFYV